MTIRLSPLEKMIERLRATGNDEPYDWSVCQEAADEIKQLRAAKQDDGAVIAHLQGEIERLNVDNQRMRVLLTTIEAAIRAALAEDKP